MIQKFFNYLKEGKKEETSSYAGFSDFFLRASAGEKRRVIKEAAQRANEDQLRVFKEAQIKIKTQ